MNFKSLHLPFFILLICSSCHEGLDPLPQTVIAEVKEKDLPSATVKLNATSPGNGQAGNWTIVSGNQSAASFSNEQDPFASFTGDPFMTYTLQWTLSLNTNSGHEEKSATVTFRIADDYSVAELVDANIALDKIADSVLVGDIKLVGVTDAQLKAAGVIGEVQDYEGNVYPWVKIKKKIWMTKNLRATKYSDGTPIESYSTYNNDPSLGSTYGFLYTWYHARRNAEFEIRDVQGVCPNGWHIPTMEDFSDLPQDGVLLKTTGTIEQGDGLWSDSGDNANEGNNNSGFSALPSGYGNYESDPDHPQLGLTYVDYTRTTGFWVSVYSAGSTTDHCGSFYLSHASQNIDFYFSSGGNRLSVRCVKD